MENCIEKLGDFKKALKTVVRTAIKSKVWAEAGEYTVVFTKTEDGKDKAVKAAVVCPCGFSVSFESPVSTRVYNKVLPETFVTLKEQMERIKGVNKVDFVVCD